MASFRNTVLNSTNFFYPLGNTPAVCLTEDLPTDHDAELLSLGCGDARSILFTLYSDDGLADGKKFDFTCCDIEPAVLARNLFLFTLLLDNQGDALESEIWNIYYHIRLNAASLDVFYKHCSKLVRLTKDSQSWGNGPYAQCLQLCDTRTLCKINIALKQFAASTSQDKRRLADALKKAESYKKAYFGEHQSLSGFRSAAPMGSAALSDVGRLHTEYWKNGTTDVDARRIREACHPNPSFASLVADNQILHYGTDPYLGFHLATAYGDFEDSSPVYENKAAPKDKPRVADACKLQFKQWCKSFRKAANGTVVIRFFTGDALSLCYTLQELSRGSHKLVSCYYDNWTLQPVNLDLSQHATEGNKAPIKFDVIDTSNLIDHIGPMNILTATAPLLKKSPSSSLVVEGLVQTDEGLDAMINNLLCGHFPSVSMLIGLTPIEYWTNTTCTAMMDEGILYSALKHLEKDRPGQHRTRIRFKKLDFHAVSAEVEPRVHFDEKELSSFLRDIYLKMFGNENVATLMANAGLRGAGKLSFGRLETPYYNRSSFAAFLRLLKATTRFDFDALMVNLMAELIADTSLMLGNNYIQELFLHLHLLGVYTTSSLTDDFTTSLPPEIARHISIWQGSHAPQRLPAVMSVTIKLPKGKLDDLLTVFSGKGTPTLCASIESSKIAPGGSWSNLFAAVQVAAGSIKTSGERNTAGFRLTIEEEVNDWKHGCDIIVSFQVPTCILFQERETAVVAFGLQATPHATRSCAHVLGPNLRIFQTVLGDESSIYITYERPNHVDSAHNYQTNFEPSPSEQNSAASDVTVGITAELDVTRSFARGLVAKVQFISSESKSELVDRTAKVEVIQQTSATLDFQIGGKSQCLLRYPVPVLASRSRLRIARKSSYVEIIAPLAYPLGDGRLEDFMLPMTFGNNVTLARSVPVNLNLTHVNLDRLPVLSVQRPSKLEWLILHTTMQMSHRERTVRETGMQPDSSQYGDRRVDFKDGIFTMFIHMSGTQGPRTHIFGLSIPESGGVHVMIFVSALKLNLADHTVVLDAAILPLTHAMLVGDTRMQKFLAGVQSPTIPIDRMAMIKVSDSEMNLWKQTLPAFVERCRTWKHKNTCEYLKTAQIPPQEGLESGQTPLCSCGVGKFPDTSDYMKNSKIKDLPWVLSKYATKAAISPCFSVPWVEDCSLNHDLGGDPAGKGKLEGTEKGQVKEGNSGERCAKCGKTGRTDSVKPNEPLQLCGRCKNIRYCSIACQKSDWKGHKTSCTKA